MIRLYCRKRHRVPGGLCPACRQLHDYAMQRLEKCPFGEDKSTCAKCKVHCYRPEMREQIRLVMRYAGPRMLLAHPRLAIAHMVDGRKAAPDPDMLRRKQGARSRR
jgi:Zn ribbon nucleic-acid-binding protein